MSSLSNTSNANEAQFAGFGTFIVSSSNPFYSTSLDQTPVSAISADSAGNITYTLSPDASADLSEVIPKSKALIKGDYTNTSNNGVKPITSVDVTGGSITVSNSGVLGVDVATSEDIYLSVKGLKTVGITVQSTLTVSSAELYDSEGSAPTTGYSSGYTNVMNFSKLVVSAGEAILALSPDYKEPNQG